MTVRIGYRSALAGDVIVALPRGRRAGYGGLIRRDGAVA
jgi:hypothetical protein